MVASSVAAAATCTYTVNTQATAPGSYTNTIAAGEVTGSYSGIATTNRAATSAAVIATST